jgi:putative transposase
MDFYAAGEQILHTRACLAHYSSVAYRGWVEESLREVRPIRDGKWTESVAVGSEAFVRATKEKLGFRARRRRVIGGDGSYELREPTAPYERTLRYEDAPLMPQNEYPWGDIV